MKKPLTVLIVEDDPEMRLVLKRVLAEVGGVEVVGEAADGATALALFERLAPRAVFIDVVLPEKDGVTLAREIFARNPWTYLVFITAYDRYREEAFAVYACDYLVKPFNLDRLRQTVERLVRFATRAGEGLRPAPLRPAEGSAGLRLFRCGSRAAVLPLKDIIFITREGRHTVVHYVGGVLKTDENLGALAAELAGYPFVRTHKGFLVNLEMVREINPCGRDTYELVLAHTKKRALMTREKFRELEALLAVGKRPWKE